MATKPSETIRLRNGTEEAKPLVASIYRALDRLLPEKPGAFFDLVSLCRNPELPITWTPSIAKLHGGGLITKTNDPDPEAPQYKVHASVRNIVLASVEGEGMDMRLVSPIAKEPRS